MQSRARHYKNVARIDTTHGNKGEVLVRSLPGLPFLLRADMSVFVSPPEIWNSPWKKLESVTELSETRARIKFEGLNSLNDVLPLVGKLILVDLDDIDDHIMLNTDEQSSLCGRRVRDYEHGIEGVIVELIESPAQLLLRLETNRGEILLPCVPEFVDLDSLQDEKASDSDGVITVHILPGLIDLNVSGGTDYAL